MNADALRTTNVNRVGSIVMMSTSNRLQMFSMWRFVVTGVVVLIGLAVLLLAITVANLASANRAKAASVEAYLRAHQGEISRAVQQTVARHENGTRLNPTDLPVALRAEPIVGAIVGEDHLSLIIYHSPDTTSGYRVWIKQEDTAYDDTATDIPGVFVFTYCNDYDDSPSNRFE